ncbi:MAG: SIR2 family protein [Bryobacterales bacterium]|nr:SIR2 family protein [Bryobacterales bacterium]
MLSFLQTRACRTDQDFLVFLNSHTKNFFQSYCHAANYEELYYLAAQLADVDGEYENPAILPFLEDARKRLTSPLHNNLFRETTKYIRHVVCDALFKLKPKPDHLRSVIQASKDESVSRLEIFTLNHDVLIEDSLRAANVRFADGFVQVPGKNYQCWKYQAFKDSQEKVRLSKLHGSIDWYHTREEDRGPSTVITSTDFDAVPGFPGNPAVLIGTFNKMLEYTMGIYADLFCAFRSALPTLDRLVISGYSFSGKGVNASIAEWTRQNKNLKLLIIAPDVHDYPRTARGSIQRLLRDCEAQIVSEPKKFEALTWEEIRNLCD